MRSRPGFVLAALGIAVVLTSCISPGERTAPRGAGDAADIRARLETWRQDFNAGRQDRVGVLFAPDLIAEIQGVPDRNHATHEREMRRVLADPKRAFSYALRIHEIIVTGDYAVVRLRWTLTVTDRQTGTVRTLVEEGMDIFRRDPEGWRICRFVVFDR